MYIGFKDQKHRTSPISPHPRCLPGLLAGILAPGIVHFLPELPLILYGGLQATYAHAPLCAGNVFGRDVGLARVRREVELEIRDLFALLVDINVVDLVAETAAREEALKVLLIDYPRRAYQPKDPRLGSLRVRWSAVLIHLHTGHRVSDLEIPETAEF